MKIKLEMEFDIEADNPSEAIALIEDNFRSYASNEHIKHSEQLMTKMTEHLDIADLLEKRVQHHNAWATHIRNAPFNYIETK